MLASSHHLASEAGAEVLREGGNAVDAAVAANAVLCVVYPQMTSIGGDLFALVWEAGSSAPAALAGAGRSGSLASIEAVRSQGHTVMPGNGALTVTVPGTVEAWGRLVERFGTFGLGRLMAPAASYARNGFIVTEHLATYLAEHAEWLMRDPESTRLLPPLKAGMTLRNPDLADTLEEIGRNGYLDFYTGGIARAVVDALQRRGGLLAIEDMATHRSQWVDPIAFRWRDFTVYELPPPTQGLVAAGMLTRLERVDKTPGLAFVRELVRARDDVYDLRERYISDPDFRPVPFEPFLDPGHRGRGGGRALPEGDTIYLCAADEHGNVVSLIQSVANSFGSGVIAEGTGVLLHNRGVYFSLEPAHVNRLEPRKRTMHTLIPAMASQEGRCRFAFGTMGADGQPQIQAQVFINLAERGLAPAEAVAAPRVRVKPGGGQLWVEADYPEALQIGHSDLDVKLLPRASKEMGHAQALIVDGTAAWRAGADPRADGSAAEVT